MWKPENVNQSLIGASGCSRRMASRELTKCFFRRAPMSWCLINSYSLFVLFIIHSFVWAGEIRPNSILHFSWFKFQSFLSCWRFSVIECTSFEFCLCSSCPLSSSWLQIIKIFVMHSIWTPLNQMKRWRYDTFLFAAFLSGIFEYLYPQHFIGMCVTTM